MHFSMYTVHYQVIYLINSNAFQGHKVISIIESAVHVFVLFESNFKQSFIYTNTCYHFYKTNCRIKHVHNNPVCSMCIIDSPNTT